MEKYDRRGSGRPAFAGSWVRGSGFLGLSLVSIALCRTLPSEACTAFAANHGEPMVAKSYDWADGTGMVLVNKRGVEKRALVLASSDTPLAWTSKLGSVTFNQYGREFPCGGMNEAGLVIEALWLDQSAYSRDDRPAVNELQWVQHALDSYATVGALVAEIDRIRIAKAYGLTHYFACDAKGDCAVIEYLGNKVVVAHGASLLVPSLTNSTYAESEARLRLMEGFGGDRKVPTGSSSLERFARASAGAARLQNNDAAGFFSVLDTVKMEGLTQWHLVYQQKARKVHFRTREQTTLKVVDLSKLDFGCTAPVLGLDIDTERGGDVTDSLTAYRFEHNERLVERTLAPIQRSLPQGVQHLVASYPESLPCVATDRAGPTEGSLPPTSAPRSSGRSSCGSGCEISELGARAPMAALMVLAFGWVARRLSRCGKTSS